MLQSGTLRSQQPEQVETDPLPDSSEDAPQPATSLDQGGFIQPSTLSTFLTSSVLPPEQAPSHGPREALVQDNIYAGPDVIHRGLISALQAEQLLLEFQNEYSQFPFVVTEAVDLAFLRQDRPFLLLAILATASHQQAELHRVLEPEFRAILARRVLVDGVHSLDLLQGLIVYLSWCVCLAIHDASKGGSANSPV